MVFYWVYINSLSWFDAESASAAILRQDAFVEQSGVKGVCGMIGKPLPPRPRGLPSMKILNWELRLTVQEASGTELELFSPPLPFQPPGLLPQQADYAFARTHQASWGESLTGNRPFTSVGIQTDEGDMIGEDRLLDAAVRVVGEHHHLIFH